MTLSASGRGRKVVTRRLDWVGVALMSASLFGLLFQVVVILTVDTPVAAWVFPALSLWFVMFGFRNIVQVEAREVFDETPTDGPAA